MFLFPGTEEPRIQLREPADEARKSPGWRVGASGRTTVVWSPEATPPVKLLEK